MPMQRKPVRNHIDLHTHTAASDGTLSPSDLVRAALDCGLDVLAITDHDTMAGVQQAIETAAGTVLRVLPGVELSAFQGQQCVHLLAYGIDHTSPFLVKKLRALSLGREDRARGRCQTRPLPGEGPPASRASTARRTTRRRATHLRRTRTGR